MSVKSCLFVLGALVCISAAVPAQAVDTVYRCGHKRYTDQPCSRHIVNTDQAAPVYPSPEVRRHETNAAIAQTMRRWPGESEAQFQTRRHRVGLPAADSAECARLDKRIPVERARMSNPDPTEALKGDAALREGSKRFTQLRC